MYRVGALSISPINLRVVTYFYFIELDIALLAYKLKHIQLRTNMIQTKSAAFQSLRYRAWTIFEKHGTGAPIGFTLIDEQYSL
uniref:Uncharacterized protein n=1 Tax=Heterorhabditis bacteriophora TaxID=37862 RepID=A0A1I7X2H1_HETBA